MNFFVYFECREIMNIKREKIKEMKGNKSKMKDKKNKMKKEMKDPESFNVKPEFKYIPNRDRLLEVKAKEIF